MRTVWKGTIGFGAFGIPVKAYSATEEHSIVLHQLHQHDGGRSGDDATAVLVLSTQ